MWGQDFGDTDNHSQSSEGEQGWADFETVTEPEKGQ